MKIDLTCARVKIAYSVMKIKDLSDKKDSMSENNSLKLNPREKFNVKNPKRR